MKSKILAGVLALGLAGTAFAQHHGHHFHGHRHGGGGNWVAPLIGGVIIGGVLAQATRPVVVQQPPVIVDPSIGVPPAPPVYYPPLQTCREVLTIVIDRFGREYRYPQTVCN